MTEINTLKTILMIKIHVNNHVDDIDYEVFVKGVFWHPGALNVVSWYMILYMNIDIDNGNISL